MLRSDRDRRFGRPGLHGLGAILAVLCCAAAVHAQTNPAAQALPYTQDFSTLVHTATAYPAGWQGWTVGTAASAAFRINAPTTDAVLNASSSASTGTGGLHNYNGKIGILTSGTSDGALALAVSTTGLSGITVAYDIMTIRNPYDGSGNTRVSEATLQYRVGTTGDFATMTGIEYRNNTTNQIGSSVTTPQNLQSRSVTLPPACNNQAVVQLRWVCRDVSGGGSRPSIAVDNLAVGSGGTAAAFGLQFDGVNDYATFGAATATLGASRFTIETWFYKNGAGVTTSTGTGGVTTAIPLVTKGRGEADGSNVDCNYFLGLQGGKLVADFEDVVTGLNHPVIGATTVLDNTWYHATATFDGASLRVYLNGVLDGTTTVTAGQDPRFDSIQHAALGSALNSTGVAAGFFAGILDEVRIWNYARNQCDIIAAMNSAVTSGAGLLGRWGLNDGSGAVAANSVGGSPNGTLLPAATPPLWVPGSPFNAVPPVVTPPAAPTGLAASAPDGVQIQLSWTDNAAAEDGYEIERSTSGSGGPFTLLATRPANSTSYTDAPLPAAGEYCYRVRATQACPGPSGYSGVACATAVDVCNALRFDPDGAGTDAHVSLGNPASLQLTAVTLEMWMRRDGPGVGTNTGSGGIPDLIPLVAKGRAEAETATQDINYIFGLRASDGVLCADFEEGPAGASPSLNHPVAGTTPIATGAWHHVAATYDGTTWVLYLDGIAQTTLAVGRPLGSASTVAVALASALNSTNAPAGFFDGALDEVRIWNYARTATQIRSTINAQITAPQSGLIGRWALDEAAGTVVYGTAGTTIHGTIVGTAVSNWDRTACAPYNLTFDPPAAPSGLVVSAAGFNQVNLAWTDGSGSETGFEIERSTTGIAGSYSLLTTVAANSTGYSNTGLSPNTEYCYRVRAVNDFGASAYAGPACATTTGSALDFAGATYVTFGDPDALDLAQFTIECWFRRDGTGTTTTTGSGGIADAIPLVAHGAQEADGDSRDMNFFLGIRNTGGVLCADFEEGPGGAGPLGLNHPVVGVTPVGAGWHHAAATYDGATWRLYLDGNAEATLAVGQPVRANTIQHASLATSLNSTGGANGFFDGALDEVRVWNYARSQAELQSTANQAIAAATPGLVARWSLDEGAGTAVGGSAGTTVNGTITGASYTWTAPAPFNLSFTPPAAPSGLTATPATHSQINLAWTDNATNETSFEIERSSTGIGGTYSLLATVGPNTNAYAHAGLTASTEYCYRVRAVNGSGASAFDGPVCATTPAFSGTALAFSGSTAQPSYASFGAPASLQLSAITLEMWLRRDGAGEGTNTGSSGISDLIPLVAKGRAEAETATQDINYIFGIRAATGTLGADFEEGAGGASPSLNHPIEGATPIGTGAWHHVAATYDGTTWKLYLDGNLDASLGVGQPLASASTVAVALASALTSANAPAGFFHGALDEVRIWNVARTQAEIRATANAQISTPTTGLVARWALDEGSGTAIGASAGTTINGTITGPNYAWSSPGAPFNLVFNQQPAPPALVAPADNATGVPTSPSLDVSVSDPDGGNLTVTYYGRIVAATPGPDFTLIGLPDTQYYTGQLNGGTNAIFQSQTNWIVANRLARNIAYVGQLGDCVEHGDNAGNDIEWQRADASLSILENPLTTGLADGIPYGVTVGNHDQSPIGNPDGTTTFYNQYFGSSRFTGRAYYGGHYGANNDNWYELFSASGLDFIVVSFEYDTSPDAAVLAWADNLLTTFGNRRAIVLSHFLCNTGNPGGFGPQGQAIYDALKGHSNLGLMLCGHVPGEGRRQDTFNGNTVHTVLSDYQGRTNGGNGWLRIMEFSPASSEIRVKTYSPWLDQFEIDGDSQFTLAYNMVTTPAFQQIGVVSGVPSGSTSSLVWPALAPGTQYEWYAVVSDGGAATEGPVWRFTTGTGTPVTPLATLRAEQVRSGNDADGTIRMRVRWDETVPLGSTVEVYRARFGGYPAYDDGGGAEPVPPASPPAPGGPWTLTAVTASDQTDEVNGAGARDTWSYVAFVKNGFGTYSAVSNLAVGRPNYLLGDVSDGLTAGAGDNAVGTADISLLGTYYGLTGAAVDAVAYLDVGPTQDYSVATRPQTDHVLDFEDLVMFAINHGTGPQPQTAPVARRLPAPAGRAAGESGATERLTVIAPERVEAGETFRVRLWLEGSGAVQALSAALTWDGAVAEPVSAEPGAWLRELGGVALSARPGTVDLALLGADGERLAGEGEVAEVRFRALASGAASVGVRKPLARDAANQPVEVATGVRLGATPQPKVTALGAAHPNPFREVTTIAFSLAEAGPVTGVVFGVDGRAVRTLTSGSWQPGAYRLDWDGRDNHGRAVAAGAYYVQLTAAGRRMTRPIVYLR